MGPTEDPKRTPEESERMARLYGSKTKEELAISKLTSAYRILCPPPDREYIDKLVKEMRASRETDRLICITVAGALITGMRYGNWPSISLTRIKK